MRSRRPSRRRRTPRPPRRSPRHADPGRRPHAAGDRPRRGRANAINIYSGAMSFLALGFRLPLALRRAIVAVVFGVLGFLLVALSSLTTARAVRELPAGHLLLDRAVARRLLRRLVPAPRPPGRRLPVRPAAQPVGRLRRDGRRAWSSRSGCSPTRPKYVGVVPERDPGVRRHRPSRSASSSPRSLYCVAVPAAARPKPTRCWSSRTRTRRRDRTAVRPQEGDRLLDAVPTSPSCGPASVRATTRPPRSTRCAARPGAARRRRSGRRRRRGRPGRRRAGRSPRGRARRAAFGGDHVEQRAAAPSAPLMWPRCASTNAACSGSP